MGRPGERSTFSCPAPKQPHAHSHPPGTTNLMTTNSHPLASSPQTQDTALARQMNLGSLALHMKVLECDESHSPPLPTITHRLQDRIPGLVSSQALDCLKKSGQHQKPPSQAGKPTIRCEQRPLWMPASNGGLPQVHLLGQQRVCR